MGPKLLSFALAMLVSVGCGSAVSAPGAAQSPSVRVRQSEEITYGNDRHRAMRCQGPSADLHYVVFYPDNPQPHPIIFGMGGTGFAGSANCPPGATRESYRQFDPIMRRWAAAGYVAVNIEYHGAMDGLFGDETYPGPNRWSELADGTTQVDIKPAIVNFLAHDSARFHGDERLGLIVFGSSSGAHNAYMVGATGLRGHRITAVIGWSGLPDVRLAGTEAEHVFDQYMHGSAISDIESFGDPIHRLKAAAPPQYIANGSNEFIDSLTARAYFERCRSLDVAACWLRIPNTHEHALEYADYVFSGGGGELSLPRAPIGETLYEDSIAFADAMRRSSLSRPSST